jgi:hypothetical protein
MTKIAVYGFKKMIRVSCSASKCRTFAKRTFRFLYSGMYLPSVVSDAAQRIPILPKTIPMTREGHHSTIHARRGRESAGNWRSIRMLLILNAPCQAHGTDAILSTLLRGNHDSNAWCFKARCHASLPASTWPIHHHAIISTLCRDTIHYTQFKPIQFWATCPFDDSRLLVSQEPHCIPRFLTF